MNANEEDDIPADVLAAYNASQVLGTSSNDILVDPFLLSALHNPRDRITVLKLDQDLEKFVRDPRQIRLELPPMSSYQRLIVHRVAQYFRLDHTAVDIDRERRGIILHKTTESKVPVLRLSDLREEPEAPPPQKALKIMRREGSHTHSHTRTKPSHHTDKSGNATDKSLEERESEYAKARARIFNESSAPPVATKNVENGIGVKSDDSKKKVEKKELHSAARNRKYSQQLSSTFDDTSGTDDFPVMEGYARQVPEFWTNNSTQQMRVPANLSQNHLAYEPFEYFSSDYGNTWEESQMHTTPFSSNSTILPSSTYGLPHQSFAGNASNNSNKYYTMDSDYTQSNVPSLLKNSTWRANNTVAGSTSFLHPDPWSPLPPQLSANAPAFEPNAVSKRTTPPSQSSQTYHSSPVPSNSLSPPPLNPSHSSFHGSSMFMPSGQNQMGFPHPNFFQNQQYIDQPWGSNGYFQPTQFNSHQQLQNGIANPSMGLPFTSQQIHSQQQFIPYSAVAFPKPVASLDYERRPPKSTELFDPKAPVAPKRPVSQGTVGNVGQLEMGMRSMALYNPNSTSSSVSAMPRRGILNSQQPPFIPVSAPVPSSKYVPSISPPPTPAHILEVVILNPTPLSMGNLDAYFGELKNVGATIKPLDSAIVLAIFKNAATAKKVLEQYTSKNSSGSCSTTDGKVELKYSLKPWVPAFVNSAGPMRAPETSRVTDDDESDL